MAFFPFDAPQNTGQPQQRRQLYCHASGEAIAAYWPARRERPCRRNIPSHRSCQVRCRKRCMNDGFATKPKPTLSVTDDAAMKRLLEKRIESPFTQQSLRVTAVTHTLAKSSTGRSLANTTMMRHKNKGVTTSMVSHCFQRLTMWQTERGRPISKSAVGEPMMPSTISKCPYFSPYAKLCLSIMVMLLRNAANFKCNGPPSAAVDY